MELGKKLSQMIFLVLRARKRKKKRKRIFYQTHQVTLSSHDSDPCQNHDNRSATFLAYSTLQRNSVQLEKYQIFHHYNPEKNFTRSQDRRKTERKGALKILFTSCYRFTVSDTGCSPGKQIPLKSYR